MSTPVFVVITAAISLIAIVLVRQVRAWVKFRGQRVIECPDNRQPAGVVVDAGHAASTGILGAPELRLSSCSRWPEKTGCGQMCLSQIATAPEDCLVRNILALWYEGKSCASCGKPVGDLEWAGSKPGLLLRDGSSVEWSAVPAEKLHETLAAAQPICFGCHTAATLMRERPDMVADRHRPA